LNLPADDGGVHFDERTATTPANSSLSASSETESNTMAEADSNCEYDHDDRSQRPLISLLRLPADPRLPSLTGSADTNAALELSLVEPSADGVNILARFNPSFTYPIFGDDERIFGYQDLKISIRYNAADMRPHLKVAYSKKFRSIGETEPTDIEGLLREILPSGECASSSIPCKSFLALADLCLIAFSSRFC
jgi:histone acetyltransferase 1